MQRDLRNIKNGRNGQTNNAGNMNNLNGSSGPVSFNNIQEAINTYSQKNDSELMNELQQRTAGLDRQQIENVARQISPMLNDAQRQRLYEIMSQLNQ